MQQWEGEVEVGGFGLRIGGDDVRLEDIVKPGEHVRVTVEWPERREFHRILAPSFGTLPPRPPGAPEKDEEAT